MLTEPLNNLPRSTVEIPSYIEYKCCGYLWKASLVLLGSDGEATPV